jgi:DNA-directed RNA polymerase alpha subunit
LKLDMEAGAVLERIYIRSKRDHTNPDVVLPTINAFASPFVSDKEELEANKASARSPKEPLPTPVETSNVATPPPTVETVNEDEDDESEEDDPPPMMTRPADDESSVDSNDDGYQECDWWTGEHDDGY